MPGMKQQSMEVMPIIFVIKSSWRIGIESRGRTGLEL